MAKVEVKILPKNALGSTGFDAEMEGEFPGGGEPDAYIKNATVDVNGLHLTKKDNSVVDYAAIGNAGYQKIVKRQASQGQSAESATLSVMDDDDNNGIHLYGDVDDNGPEWDVTHYDEETGADYCSFADGTQVGMYDSNNGTLLAFTLKEASSGLIPGIVYNINGGDEVFIPAINIGVDNGVIEIELTSEIYNESLDTYTIELPNGLLKGHAIIHFTSEVYHDLSKIDIVSNDIRGVSRMFCNYAAKSTSPSATEWFYIHKSGITTGTTVINSILLPSEDYSGKIELNFLPNEASGNGDYLLFEGGVLTDFVFDDM